MKIINKIGFVLAVLVFALGLSVLPIQAEEEEELTSYVFDCSWTHTYTYLGKEYVVVHGQPAREILGKDVKVFSFGYIDHNTGNVSFSVYAFSPYPIIYSGSSSGNRFVDVDGEKVYYYQFHGFGTHIDFSRGDLLTYEGIPNLTLYSEERDLSAIAENIAQEMAAAGFYDYDDSEWIHEPEFKPDISGAKSAGFSLSDVKFSRDEDYFYASWSGLTDYLGNEDVSKDFVFVSAGFYNSGISVSKDVGYFYLSDGFLKIPFSKLSNYENDVLSMIKLVPYHYAGSDQSILYKGQSASTYFNDLFFDDEWSTYYDPNCFLVNPNMSYTKGNSALSGTVSAFMGKELNNGFYSYSSRNMKYLLTWESVNTAYEADLSLSHMRIDIVCNDQEYVFSDSAYSLSSKKVDLSLENILLFLQEQGIQPVIESFSIKYTPYYMVGRKTYHGRSIRFIVEANSAGILQVSQDDDSLGEDSDYTDVDIVQPDDLPIVIPGFTDDESFEFDFSYDADNMFKNFFNSLRSLISYCGQIPALVNKVFSFLPSAYGDMIVIILAACFIMRLLGR